MLAASHTGVTKDSQAMNSSALSEHHNVGHTVLKLREACAASSLHSAPCHLGRSLLELPDSRHTHTHTQSDIDTTESLPFLCSCNKEA